MTRRERHRDWMDELNENDEPVQSRSARQTSKLKKNKVEITQTGNPCEQATVIASFGRHCVARDTHGKQWQVFGKGKKTDVAVGDAIRIEPSGEEQAWIADIGERRNLVYRSDEFRTKQFAANLDQVMLVLSVSPPYSPALVCRTVVACQVANIPLVVLLNKTDLIENIAQETERLRTWVPKQTEIKPLCLHNNSMRQRAQLLDLTQDKSTLVLGQSGMGKSTLVNLLVPSAQAATAGISTALNSGKHTTTTTLMHDLPEGGHIIDSPGFQAFGLAHLTQAEIQSAFPDIADYALECRFSNCLHQQEPGCSVMAAVDGGVLSADRLNLYQQLLAERRV